MNVRRRLLRFSRFLTLDGANTPCGVDCLGFGLRVGFALLVNRRLGIVCLVRLFWLGRGFGVRLRFGLVLYILDVLGRRLGDSRRKDLRFRGGLGLNGRIILRFQRFQLVDVEVIRVVACAGAGIFIFVFAGGLRRCHNSRRRGDRDEFIGQLVDERFIARLALESRRIFPPLRAQP